MSTDGIWVSFQCPGAIYGAVVESELDLRICWVVLTMGDRPAELRAALASIRAVAPEDEIVVIENGGEPGELSGARSIALAENIGIPGGRDLAVAESDADLHVFLDDDAIVKSFAPTELRSRFAASPRLGVVSFRLVDEQRESAQRHVPRFGGRDAERGGDVATFLGGACAIRTTAYREVGGYWTGLWYGHEELDLAWRLLDRGWDIAYDPSFVIFHPHTEISRHGPGWRLTGRNRVLVARRSLPWPLVWVHTSAWLVLGSWRAPDRVARRSYFEGWRSGWSHPIERAPLRWRTVWHLTRLRRPPVL